MFPPLDATDEEKYIEGGQQQKYNAAYDPVHDVAALGCARYDSRILGLVASGVLGGQGNLVIPQPQVASYLEVSADHRNRLPIQKQLRPLFGMPLQIYPTIRGA